MYIYIYSLKMMIFHIDVHPMAERIRLQKSPKKTDPKTDVIGSASSLPGSTAPVKMVAKIRSGIP